MAPVLTFTADEAWSFGTTSQEFAGESIHLQDWPVVPTGWRNAEVEADMTALLQLRTKVNETLEPLRQAGTIGKSLDAVLTVTGQAGDAAFKALEKHRDFLAELFIVSHVTMTPQPDAALGLAARHAKDAGYARCPRCWRSVPTLVQTPAGEVCPRCEQALKS
jgi:isoleucyl-tRNA synthetase